MNAMPEVAAPPNAHAAARWKRAAAERAVEWVQSGMVVGLGAGSTAQYAVERLAALVALGELTDILAVPCSRQIGAVAARLGLTLTTIEEHPQIDVTIDGADEVDPMMELIKGGGGALLHEKIVAQATKREIIVVDASKLSPALGTHHALPVEVVAFGSRSQALYLEALGATVQIRRGPDGAPFRTEEDNLILDCAFGPIRDPRALAEALDPRAGIVAHGLFLDLATDLLVAGQDGVRHVMRAKGTRT